MRTRTSCPRSSRRGPWPTVSGVLALLLPCALLSPALRAAPARPNFLFIYTDDQRWDALGVVQREQGVRARFPWFQTPNLDRLAVEGMRFRNAFVVNALCSPSRACFLTGRYNHVNGIASNFRPFPTNSVTHATLLRAAGYVTGYIGKWHMDNQSGQRPGFDYSASFTGHARYFDAFFELNGVRTPTQGWVDDVSTDYAIGFLREQKERPWLLVVGYKTPHGPFEPPPRATNRFAGALARSVPNLDRLPPFPGVARPTRHRPPGELPPATGPVNLDYFRCLSAVDENVGRLLRTLEELGLEQNTIVVYASDNGFYLGEHSLADKRSAYEESIRIPLLVRYPKLGARGQVLDEMVLNIDLAPTLLDFAGVPVPREMQGRSWRPLLEGKAIDWRRAWFYEYFWERQKGNPTPTLTAVRTDRAKLIRYHQHEEWTELFDLRADPYETRNLYRDPAHAGLRTQLEAEHARLAREVSYLIPDYVDQPEDAPPERTVLNAFVLDYRFSHDDADRVVDGSGQNNHGTANGAAVVEGRDGRKARRFDGRGYIEVPKSKTLDPSEGPWTVEVVLQTEQANAIILARGGQAQGYALWLEQGRPVFGVRARERESVIRGPAPVTNRWVHLAGVITTNRELVLYLDGQTAARGRLHAFIPHDPNDTMQVGADLGSPVTGNRNPPRLVGLVESVRIFSGERRAADIRRDASAR